VDTNKRIAIVVGLLYIVGTVAGVLSVLVTNPILNDPEYLARLAADGHQFIVGALLVLTMGVALALVPVVLYPIARKHSEVLAMGYVVFRGALEPIAYIGMAISWLALVVLSREAVQAGAADASYYDSLGAVLLGTNEALNQVLIFVFSIGALMLYSLFYQSRLIPRWLSAWGFIAIALHLATGFLLLFAPIGASSPVILALNLAIFLQEMVMAVWLIVQGFNPSAVAAGSA
jgi:hypothetical protein